MVRSRVPTSDHGSIGANKDSYRDSPKMVHFALSLFLLFYLVSFRLFLVFGDFESIPLFTFC